MTLGKAKKLRLLYRVLFALIGFVTPIVILLVKFNLKTGEITTTKSKITFIGMFIILVAIALLWRFKTSLYEWINQWEYSLLKYILIGFSKVYIFILIIIISVIVRADVLASMEAIKQGITTGMNNILFCLITFCVCQVIAYIVIYPLEQKYHNLVLRFIRKQERIEDYREAQK